MKTRVLVATLISIVFVGCDSGIDGEDVVISDSEAIEAAQRFYESFHGLRANSSGDSVRAFVLAEMVRQHPPDWTQAVAWPDGRGGMHVVTLIGVDKPATSFSHDDVSVVRTLMADVNSAGIATTSRLLEFISSDPLDRSQFQHYAKQWLVGDYDATKMMTSEYTLGFESEKAQLFLSSDSALSPVNISLKEITRQGKTQDEEYWCWVSDYTRGGDVCFEGANGCQHTPGEIEITCICTSGCEEHDMGGGGGGDPGSPADRGGRGGGGDRKSTVEFDLSCDQTITRGQSGGCSVSATQAGKDVTDQYDYQWSASSGATQSSSSSWNGTAISGITVTVTVSSESWSDSKKISVTPRSGWSVAQFNAPLRYRAMATSLFGFYEIPGEPPVLPAPVAGTGPWHGDYMTGNPPTVPATLWLNSFFTTGGRAYPDADDTCDSSSTNLRYSENYYAVNSYCGSLNTLLSFRAGIVRHERYHEAGLNACLSGSTGKRAMAAMERITGSESSVRAKWNAEWNMFYRQSLNASGWAGSAVISQGFVWSYAGKWQFGRLTAAGHGNAQFDC